MSKFHKQFEHKGYKFNTSVELNTKVENGKDVWRSRHTVITDSMNGNNHSQRDEVTATELEYCIERQKNSAIAYIDRLTSEKQTLEEIMLSKMGFKKDLPTYHKK